MNIFRMANFVWGRLRPIVAQVLARIREGLNNVEQSLDPAPKRKPTTSKARAKVRIKTKGKAKKNPISIQKTPKGRKLGIVRPQEKHAA